VSGDELDISGEIFKAGSGAVANAIDDEYSGAIDLSDLIAEVERGEAEEKEPPSLLDRPSLLWSVTSGLHSSLLSTSAPTATAEGWQALAEELAEESRHIKDPHLKAATMCEAGRILIERLGRREEGQLLMKNSGSSIADVLLDMRSEGLDSLATELSDLENTAKDKQLDEEYRAAAWVEFGLLCEQHAANRTRALTAYDAALQLVPNHPVALSLAIDAAVLLDDREAALRHLEARLKTCNIPQLKLALLLDMAELAEDPKRRRELLEQAHESDPNEETALRRLIRVVSAAGEGGYLGRLYRRLAEVSEDPISGSTALHLAFLTLVEAEEPVEDLVHDLAEQARDGDTQEVLAPLSEVALYMEQAIAGGQFEGMHENAALLERLAKSLDAPREQALVREQLARLRLNRLRRLQETAPAPQDSSTGLPKLSEDRIELCRALESDLRFCLVHLPEHRWVRESLAELLEYVGDLAGLVLHLQEWSRMQSAGPGRAAILLRLGAVHETLRSDLPRAAEVYELAVAEDPDDADCLRALGRVYERMRRWQQAIAALQRQAQESDSGPERLSALRRVAAMAQHELSDVDLAVATLEEIASLDPDDLLSLFQLAALCRAHGRLPVLVNTLQLLVERLDDEVARTAILVELGEVQELHLKQRDAAREAYERALKLSPGYTPALQALARLYRDNGDLDSLLGMHEPEVDPITDPAVLLLKAARVSLDEVGDMERTIEYLWRAYKTNPDLVPAREQLLHMLTVQGRIGEAYDLLRAQELPESVALAADYQYRLGLLAEALAREEGPGSKHEDAALQHYRAALNAQPDHGLAWERSRRLLVAHHDIPNLVRLVGFHKDHESGVFRAHLLVQLGRLESSLPQAGAEARRSYEEASQVAPTDPLIRREYEGLLRRADDSTSLPAVYLVTGRHSEDTHYKATLLVEAAELLLRSGKPEDRELAASAILEALHDDPGNPYAVRHLERLLTEPNTPVAVTDAVGARAVRAQSDAERAIFYLESAELLERGSALDQARRAYQAALGAIPTLAPAELGVSRVAEGRVAAPPPRAPAAAQPVSLHNLMAEARDLAVRAGTTGSQVEGEKALSVIGRILDRDPNHRDALALARALTGQLPDPSTAIELLSGVFPRVQDVDMRYDLALLLGESAPRLEEAVGYLNSAVEAKPDGKQALHALVRSYRQMGLDLEAADATERLLAQYDAGEPTAIDLRTGLATFLGKNDDTVQRAVDHARVVLDARPGDQRAVSLMADLLQKQSRHAEAADLLDRLISRERERDRLHELHLRQAILWEKAGDDARALASVEHAAEINAGHRETISLLTTLLERRGEVSRLSAHLDAIRAAMMANIARGAVSIRDLRVLAEAAKSSGRATAETAEMACYALDPHSGPPPDQHLRPATPKGFRALLTTPEMRSRFYAPGESQQLHELLQAVDVVLPRLSQEFPIASTADAGPVPPNADPSTFSALLRQWSQLHGFPNIDIAASPVHNAAVLLRGAPATLHVGNNLWMQGDPTAWRGLAAVAFARHAFGAPVSRALNPMELDLLLAGCFESAGVFNAITADPDPRRLRELTAQLNKLLPRKHRKTVEKTCQAISGLDIVPSATASSTLASDLRLAAVMTGDFGGCLSAACLLDGVAGGSLKQRISRSRAAQALLIFTLSDDYERLRAAAMS
jgi:tetratricopeptide (TPR) repeat protein